MTTTELTIGLGGSERISSRVLKPPGGGSSNIFGPPDDAPVPSRPRHSASSASIGDAPAAESAPPAEEPADPAAQEDDADNRRDRGWCRRLGELRGRRRGPRLGRRRRRAGRDAAGREAGAGAGAGARPRATRRLLHAALVSAAAAAAAARSTATHAFQCADLAARRPPAAVQLAVDVEVALAGHRSRGWGALEASPAHAV
ncbi:uncharacterized protein LOC119108201 [Pollicipes pollicipes]|uniref:uncharacterized protein LOC119108201 n=1 Tax=Pollicipes pollicipes TaxID=41117 RepID=UPI0018850B9C|nr:uncharacterized protein LOC119108201 [Pollicipes pollicipes]